jgi:hypothetical protein
MSNQPMASKTFCLQNLCNFIATLNPKFFTTKTICEFDFVCKIYEFPKKFKMKIQNENEWKINFVSSLRGQIVRYMFVGGLFTNYPTHIVINHDSPISYMWMDGWMKIYFHPNFRWNPSNGFLKMMVGLDIDVEHVP